MQKDTIRYINTRWDTIRWCHNMHKYKSRYINTRWDTIRYNNIRWCHNMQKCKSRYHKMSWITSAARQWRLTYFSSAVTNRPHPFGTLNDFSHWKISPLISAVEESVMTPSSWTSLSSKESTFELLGTRSIRTYISLNIILFIKISNKTYFRSQWNKFSTLL